VLAAGAPSDSRAAARIRALCSTPATQLVTVTPVSQRLRDAERRLEHILGLSPERATRAVAEVIDCFELDVDSYIAERHAELQREGLPNAEIYALIESELPTLRFKAAALSARQIRRRIYG
jgi:hypothetical protein